MTSTCVANKMSCIVNCSVFCITKSKTIFPWTILKVPECELSFGRFFETEVESRISAALPLELKSASAGNSKDSMDEVDLMLQVRSVISLFGPYVKYRTASVENEVVVHTAASSPQSSLPSTQSTHYPSQRNPRNNKDMLYNHIVHCFQDRNLSWDSDSIISASKLVQNLTDVLWYIDGHHEQFSNVPLFFTQFQGYNKPELSKHRKRRIANLDHSILEMHVNNLSTLLQCTYWDKSSVWTEFKSDVCGLMESLYSYVQHLYKKQKVTATNHRQETPVRSLADNMQLTLLPVTQDYHLQLDSLVQNMVSEIEYSSKFINDLYAK